MARFKGFVILVTDLNTGNITVHGSFKDYGTADGKALRFKAQALREGKALQVDIKGIRQPTFAAISE